MNSFALRWFSWSIVSQRWWVEVILLLVMGFEYLKWLSHLSLYPELRHVFKGSRFWVPKSLKSESSYEMLRCNKEIQLTSRVAVHPLSETHTDFRISLSFVPHSRLSHVVSNVNASVVARLLSSILVWSDARYSLLSIVITCIIPDFLRQSPLDRPYGVLFALYHCLHSVGNPPNDQDRRFSTLGPSEVFKEPVY